MYCAGQLHSVKDALPPDDSDVLVYWESTGQVRRAVYIKSPSGDVFFRTRDVGGALTPTHWAFFNPGGV